MTPGQLRRLLEAKRIGPTRMAEMMEVSRSTVNRWLTGETPISKANKLLILSTIG